MIPPRILELIEKERQEALQKYGKFITKNHGLAVIQQEFNELFWYKKWSEVRGGTEMQEAIQVAAMAIEYLIEFGNF